jgi:hypothetical protein
MYWLFVNGTEYEIQNRTVVLTATCLSNRVDPLRGTLSQSKLVTVVFSATQSPETDVNVAMRHKKIISCMLVWNPVINENKRYMCCVWPFFPFAQWTQWHTVMVHRLFWHSFHWLNTDSSLDVLLKATNFFFFSSFSTFHVQSLKPVHRQYLIFD